MLRNSPLINTLCLSAALLTSPVSAETPAQILNNYQQAAITENPGFAGFSATRGKALFENKHANDWSCTSCHTRNPAAKGKHIKTGKAIDPLAPAANAKRFTKTKTVEKWFRRNCNDVLERKCTTVEKGDVMTYLISVSQ